MKAPKFYFPLLCVLFSNLHVSLGLQVVNIEARQSSNSLPSPPIVPYYNISVPVDHFDSSSKETYTNRYWVNDTYYKPGGPVILYDQGESGVSATIAAQMLAEFGGFQSAPMQLARKLNALVVLWEHRYYGYSRPVPLDDQSGLPKDGVAGYKYLTVDQALEDVAYFANNFNTTELTYNKVTKDTSTLDPYHTPWIMIGGSYPGLRAAWSRLKHPEVFYASWSSSAPVQLQYDGSPFYNPIMRALPKNCTDDISAAIKYVDSMAMNPTSQAWQLIQAAVYSLQHGGPDKVAKEAYTMRPFDVGNVLQTAIQLLGNYQSLGAILTTQPMCDYLESFDVGAFQKAQSSSQNIAQALTALVNNPGGKQPSKDGIAALDSKNGGSYAMAALIYGIYRAVSDLQKFTQKYPAMTDKTVTLTPVINSVSWQWQVLAELGCFQGSNSSRTENFAVVSAYTNVTAVQQYNFEQNTFKSFSVSSFPDKPNNTQFLAWGGWNMKASNVMFTNGEFDSWRAFSVHSQEVDAPNRTTTQTVPACNQVSDDVFGLVYAGSAHSEDMVTTPWRRGSIEKTTPLNQGLELFLKAWDVWAPCFNQSRDDIRNGKTVDGQDSNGGSSSSDDQDNSGERIVPYVQHIFALAIGMLLIQFHLIISVIVLFVYFFPFLELARWIESQAFGVFPGIALSLIRRLPVHQLRQSSWKMR